MKKSDSIKSKTTFPVSLKVPKLVEIARGYIGTKEEGTNKGAKVEQFQKAVDGVASGEPWCMGFVQFCISEAETALGVKANVFRTESCVNCWVHSDVSARVEKPASGDLILWKHIGQNSGHVGIVEEVKRNSVITIEGNTGDGSGIVREGDGVYRRERKLESSDKMKIMGFLRVFSGGEI